MIKNYVRPELHSVYAEVEQGFSHSSTLDGMYETSGNWD